jgi:hypothetical protein
MRGVHLAVIVAVAATWCATAWGTSLAGAVPPQFVVAQVRGSIARAKDRHPITAQFVLTRRQAANAVLSGASVNSNQPVYVVAVRGSFLVIRPGLSATGFMRVSVLTYVFDARTGRETDDGFSRAFPKMSRLGRVHNLLPYLRT